MDIWLVTNGYRGNGYVTVIVAAYSEESALAQGTEALRVDNARMKVARHPEDEWLREVKAEKITLPYMTEIG